MKKNHSISYFGMLILAMFLSLAITSCKKEKSAKDDPTQIPPSNQLSDADSLKYLMYHTMQVSFQDGGRDTSFLLPTYYWYNQVPKLDPLSAIYDSADVLLNKMKEYPKDGQGLPIDKYSFLDNGEVAGEIQGGVAGDLGMEVSFAYDEDRNIVLVVLYADKNGPAGLAGVKRGYQISQINGANVVYDNGPGIKKVEQAIFYANQSTFTFKRQDKTSFTKDLIRAGYPINPILFDTVYSVGNKKVGYFVFSTFSNIVNATGNTLTKSELDRVFSKFEGAGITSLIADFRYNGGGSVNTAEYITSKIAPSSAIGKTMYRYKYNDNLTANATTVGLQEKVDFKETGNLNLQNVFFIGTGRTASASELVMNNLKPYVNVKLVGDTTYGKPVGFFSFTLSIFKNGVEKDLADLYAINFETLNANNQGGYYHGLFPDAIAADFIGTPWGDPTKDENLIKIFNYVGTGNYGRMSTLERMNKDKSLLLPVNTSLKSSRFNGMVNYKIGGIIKENIERNSLKGGTR